MAWDDVAKFTTVDYVVFAGMLLASLALGLLSTYRRSKQSSIDYFQSKGSLSPVGILLSLLGGSISAISVLGNAGETYAFGTQVVVVFLGMLLATVLIYFVILPAFFTFKIVSINEYLELRYESVVLRRMSAVCQMVSLLLVMGLILYAPTLVLATVTDLPSWASMLLLASVCTFYTSMGGVRAVVWTDMLQTVLMLGGVVVVVIFSVQKVGNVSAVWDIAYQGSRISFLNIDPSPFVRHSFWSTTVSGFYLTLFLFGVNQAAFQRFSALNSLQQARRVCIMTTLGWIVMWSTFFYSGIVAYAIYHDCDPVASGKIDKVDQIVPYMVMQHLHNLTGIPGLFVAAIYGAVLSSVSSYCNSFVCLLWEDFMKEMPYFSRLGSSGVIIVLRISSFMVGVAGLVMAHIVAGFGNLLQLANTLSSSVYSPVIGVYLAGLLTPWVNSKGAITGLIVALIFNIWIVSGSLVQGKASPVPLPMSIDGCNATLNSTGNTFDDSFINPIFSTTNDTFRNDTVISTTLDNRSPSHTVYDISYCYFGIMSVIIVLLVSSLVSFATRVVNPWALKPGLVAPGCTHLYRLAWTKLRGESGNKEDANLEVTGDLETNF